MTAAITNKVHIITRNETPGQPGWQKALATAVSDPTELLTLLGLPSELTHTCTEFPLRVPRGYIARMRKGDPDDPLLKQVLTTNQEQIQSADFMTDPVGDIAAMPIPGLLHKYHGRALLITTGACAIHCRYCFRRHFPYGDNNTSGNAWSAALEYLASDKQINEVILSGGDPLSLNDRRLAALTKDLEAIQHLKRLRIHSRLPIVLPERVDDALLAWLANTTLQTVLVVHANHANEIDDTVQQALTRLKESGVTLLNQSVLLRGINDDLETLALLSERLFDCGVLPYYLHTMDKVRGAAHFEVDDKKAAEIVTGLQARLPGYLVPKLVRETAGGAAKTPLF